VKAAEERGHPQWGTPPKNAGHYNSRPYETGFFREKGDYDSYYGRFFLNWYSQTLIEHADRVLNLANTIFEGIKMGAKVTHNQLASTNRTSKSITLHQDPMPLRMIVFKHLPMLQKRMAENMSLVTLQSHEH